METKKAQDEFIEDGDIFDGARTFPGLTLSSDNNEGLFAIFLFYSVVRNKRADRLRKKNSAHYDLS